MCRKILRGNNNNSNNGGAVAATKTTSSYSRSRRRGRSNGLALLLLVSVVRWARSDDHGDAIDLANSIDVDVGHFVGGVDDYKHSSYYLGEEENQLAEAKFERTTTYGKENCCGYNTIGTVIKTLLLPTSLCAHDGAAVDDDVVGERGPDLLVPAAVHHPSLSSRPDAQSAQPKHLGPELALVGGPPAALQGPGRDHRAERLRPGAAAGGVVPLRLPDPEEGRAVRGRVRVVQPVVQVALLPPALLRTDHLEQASHRRPGLHALLAPRQLLEL